MRKLLFAASLAVFFAGMTSPAWAPRGPNWSQANAATIQPAGDYCKTDPATLQQCTTMKNTCLSQTTKTWICKSDFYNCCRHMAIRRWN